MSAILKEPNLIIRKMREQDLEAVFENEKAAYTHPWTKGILRDCLRVGYHCQVVEQGGDLIGHAVLSAAVGEAHLLNISVAPAQQRRGIGRRLLRRMLRIAGEQGADTVFLEVRVSNAPAQYLYQSEGFCELGRRSGYYPHDKDGREDAVIYAKPLMQGG